MTIEERVADLERRVSLLEDSRNLVEVPGHQQRSQHPVRVRSKPIASDSEALERAEALFDELLSVRKVISYSGTYRRVLGQYDAWRNAIHPAAIIRIAVQTEPREVDGIELRLDTLIVGKERRRPADGHFKDAPYDEADWIRAFGTWPLLD